MSRKFNSITIKVSYLTKALYEVSFAYDGLGCTKFSTQLDAGWHSGYGLRNGMIKALRRMQQRMGKLGSRQLIERGCILKDSMLRVRAPVYYYYIIILIVIIILLY